MPDIDAEAFHAAHLAAPDLDPEKLRAAIVRYLDLLHIHVSRVHVDRVLTQDEADKLFLRSDDVTMEL